MPVQTTYSAELGKGFEGQRADFGLMNLFSRVCEEADGIAFGRAVIRGTDDDQAKLPSASGQDFIGVTNQTSAWSEKSDGNHVYQLYREMNIMDIGPMWVYTEQSVVPGDKVFFRHTAKGGNTVIGRFRKDNDENTADEIKNATFETTATAGEIVLIWLRGNETIENLYEEIVAASGALSIETLVSLFDTTVGAATATLADGYEGQVKILTMVVDGGNMVVTPANLFGGTTLTFTKVGDAITLRFIDGNWHPISVIGVQGLDVLAVPIEPTVETIVATSGAISLVTALTLFDTTAGASTSTLADGEEGQIKRLKMTVDGGDQVLTPANLSDGTTLTFGDVNDSCELMFSGGTWHVISNNGVVIA